MFNLNYYVGNMKFEIEFFGHKNIRSTHKNTIEITKDEHLTTNGDCIIGVNANYSCNDLPISLKNKLRNSFSIITVTIIVNNISFHIVGSGNQSLSFTDKNDIVLRKSNYVCPRTLAINCNKASLSIPRIMIKSLQNPTTRGKFIISVE